MSRPEAGPDRSALASVGRVAQHPRSRFLGHRRGRVGRSIVDDPDGHARPHLGPEPPHDVLHRVGRVEGRDENRGAHQLMVYYLWRRSSICDTSPRGPWFSTPKQTLFFGFRPRPSCASKCGHFARRFPRKRARLAQQNRRARAREPDLRTGAGYRLVLAHARSQRGRCPPRRGSRAREGQAGRLPVLARRRRWVF